MPRFSIFDDPAVAGVGGYTAPADYKLDDLNKPQLPDPGSGDAFKFTEPSSPLEQGRPMHPDDEGDQKRGKGYDPNQPKKPFMDFWDWREMTPNGSFDQYKKEYPDDKYEKELNDAPDFSWKQFKQIFPDATPEKYKEFNDRMNQIPSPSQDDLRRGYDLFMREPQNKGTTFDQYKEKFWKQYPSWEDLDPEDVDKEMTEAERNETKRRSATPLPVDRNDAMNRAWYDRNPLYRALGKRPDLFWPKDKPTIKIPPTPEQEKKQREDEEKKWDGFKGF